jgi:hypothetical protein
MKPESRALGQTLLDLHRKQTATHPPGKRLVLKNYTMAYGDLCSAAKVGHLTRIVGGFLQEIAEWCAQNGYPPLNSLAVNGGMGQPGEGYDGAGGFKAIDWATDVEKCIRFTGYPPNMP